MKKILLSLFSFIFLHSYAVDVRDVATFDFTNPHQLPISPALSPADINFLDKEGDVLVITNRTITEHDITISFSNATGYSGAAINHYFEYGENGEILNSLYSLSIRNRASICFEGKDCNILSIEFRGDFGALTLPAGEPGSLNTVTKVWNNNGQRTSKVTFVNGVAADTRIYGITVHYDRPAVPMTLLSSEPEDNSLLSSFSSMKLNFNTDIISVTDPMGVMLTSNAFIGGIPMRVSSSGNQAVLSLDSPLNTTGLYTITVPEGKFVNDEKSVNKQILRHFSLRIPLKLEEVIPSQGKYASFPDSVSLVFDHDIVIDDAKSGNLVQDNQVVGTVKFYADTISKNKVNIQVKNFLGHLDAESTWLITVPKGTVHSTWFRQNDDLDSWNDSITLKYDVEKENSAAMQAAKALIANEGVGYPAEGSIGRDSLFKAISTDASSEELNDAMSAFYNETDVTKPKNGTWYRIVAVNGSEQNPQKAYLTYNDGAVTLGDRMKASVFLASAEGDKILFQTPDHKGYLHVLTTNNDYTHTTPKNVTLSETPGLENKLTLEKIASEGVDRKLALGKMSISGFLGYDKATAKDLASSTATIDFANMRIVDNLTNTIYFDSTISSAFVFDEGFAPDTIRAEVTLSENVLTHPGDSLKLIFTNIDKATLIDANKPYFRSGNEKVTYPRAILEPTADPCVFDVNTQALYMGSFSLVLPKGTFVFEQMDKTVKDEELTVELSVNGGYVDDTVVIDPNLKKGFSAYSVLQQRLRHGDITDKELEDLVLFTNASDQGEEGLVANPNITVKIVGTGSDAIGTGHFEAYPDFNASDYGYDPQYVTAIKLVMDIPITDGVLDNMPGRYGYVIPAGAFGDNNYGKYLADNSSIAPSLCNVNDMINGIAFVVNNRSAKINRAREMLSKAKELKDLKGLGYPKEDSQCRANLDDLIKQLEPIAQNSRWDNGNNDILYNKAIDDFLNETDVVLPTNGLFYSLCARTSDRTNAYVTVNDDGEIGLSRKEDVATAFKMVDLGNGTYKVISDNDFYLQQLSDTTLSSSYDPFLNLIAFQKLLINGVSPERTLGLFSFQANKKFPNGILHPTYALVDADKLGILSPSADATSFNNYTTNAFSIALAIPKVNQDSLFSPKQKTPLGRFSKVKLTLKSNFPGVSFHHSGVDTLIYVYGIENNGEKSSWTKYPKSVTTTGEKNEFQIAFDDVPFCGSWKLVIKKGAFYSEYAGERNDVREITGVWDGNSSSVEDIYSDVESKVTIYDFQGRKVKDGNLRKGLYIQNGKKKIVK